MAVSNTNSRSQAGRRRQARVMGLVNAPMRVLLALPFRTPMSKSLMLAYLTGRKSGRRYRVPLSYVHDGETLLTPGGGRWKLNLVEGRAERLKIGGRDLMAAPELVSEIDEVDRLMEVMVAGDSRILSFSGIGRDADGRIDRAQLAPALKHGFRIVRWRPTKG
jgi:hypothetical protein